MATIKEVARLANVSIGTVSNVINGRTQNEKLIERVEWAIKELSFRPDANARSLKNTKSRIIGLIVPSLMHPDCLNFLSEAETLLRERGYGLLLKNSRNNKLLEKKSLEQCIEHCVDGIIFYSFFKTSVEEQMEKVDIPLVRIGKFGINSAGGDLIHIGFRNAFEDALASLVDSGKTHVALILESKLMMDELLPVIEKYGVKDDHVKIVDYSKERGFKAAYELLNEDEVINAVIASNALIEAGVQKALESLGRDDVSILSFREGNWIDNATNSDGVISVSQKRIAEKAVSRIMKAIENPNIHEELLEEVEARFEPSLISAKGGYSGDKSLRFAMFNSPAARGLLMLSRRYQELSGVTVEFDLFNYDDLEKLIFEPGEMNYDGYMLDITWLDEAAQAGRIKKLDVLEREDPEYLKGFIDGMLDVHGKSRGSLYALPFMSGTQLLFYQKNLFEDQALKRQFFRQYQEELAPPGNWAQFNIIAEFFTRSCNPKSPVDYGTIRAFGDNIFSSIGFLNRLWAYGADFFDEEGNVILNSPNALTALKNYVKSFRYTPRDEGLCTWDDVVETFKKGSAAMVVMYDSHAVEINDYTRSRVAGNIGCSLAPGGISVLGGWSLALNGESKEKKGALSFIKWTCSEENATLISLLGGSTLRKNYYGSSDLENIYPWKSLVLESYKRSKKRAFPENRKGHKKHSDIYTHMVPAEINRVIRQEITAEEALENMAARL